MDNNTTIEEFRKDPQLMFDFMAFFFNFHPREYQKKFLIKCLHNKKIAGKWSRQSGKSTSVAAYLLFMLLVANKNVMITAPTLTQSSELYNKVRAFAANSEFLNESFSRITQTELTSKKGGRIKALPSGTEGKSIRGFTADIVVEEEAGLLSDEINNSVIMPMLASKKDDGQVIKIGTPWKKNHFYRSCFIDPTFEVVNVTWKDCVAEGQYSQQFIDDQRKLITELQFRTEYEAEFIEEMSSFFPLTLVQSCMEDYNLIKII